LESRIATRTAPAIQLWRELRGAEYIYSKDEFMIESLQFMAMRILQGGFIRKHTYEYVGSAKPNPT